jgi:hypothetical protein
MKKSVREGFRPYLVLLTGGFLAFMCIAAASQTVSTARQLQNDWAGRCTIRAKRLLEQQKYLSWGDGSYQDYTIYTPDFQFSVQTADGQQYQVEGPDRVSPASDQSGAQAALDEYTVGKSYRCWYDPTDPSQAVLSRRYDWGMGFFGLVLGLLVGGLVICGGVLMLVFGDRWMFRVKRSIG